MNNQQLTAILSNIKSFAEKQQFLIQKIIRTSGSPNNWPVCHN
jgi:hypothetical protein